MMSSAVTTEAQSYYSDGEVSDTSYERTRDLESNGLDVDDGEAIFVPFLARGYDWNSLVTSVDKPTICVSPDYLPELGRVSEIYVVNRCKYLNLELTAENKEKVKDTMESHLHNVKTTLKRWLQKYWVDVAHSLNIKFGEGFDVTTYSELQSAVRQCRTAEVAKKIVITYYLSLDLCGNFRKKIAKCLLQQFGLKLEERKSHSSDKTQCGKRKSRKKKNCFEKLVTQIMTEQRKNINNIAVGTCGVTFTAQRAGILITDENEFDFRKKRRFYDWMVMGFS
jgi:hypothetical protein